ncbi:TorF family putative porin [Brevundimonas goettingensis]|jgi:uncharacterized protein (TIGR02001 family)|uniref:Cellulose biosynthesis protein BcsS n=1 Tax=Brevundimonas goettingensis TaxID=2774190 RepID=A0A975GXE1_9CAUL|nr:TorF family putative porin [Brevundimonas goettingensis]QTC92784.1 hypothetical protein IFJ75_08005 [Brevundimonas goettingensis]
MLKPLSASLFLLGATPVLAGSPPSSPEGTATPTVATAWRVEGTAGVVSDYRFRGYSLSGGEPAVQAGLTLTHVSGFYVDVYSSSIEDYGVDSDGNGAEVELTGSLGWRGQASGIDVEASVAAYRYPGGEAVDYVEIPVQAGRSFLAFTVTAGLAYAPAQRALGDADNLYEWIAVDYAPGGWPVSLSGRVGRERGAFAEDGKWDWEAGLSKDLGVATMGLSWTDSDRTQGAWVASLFLSF